MSWSTIWELTKINILYSNPQTLSSLKKQQARKPKKTFSAYKSMLRNQLILIALFAVIYIYLFTSMNFRDYPGFFSFYVGTFFIMATISAFTAMYSIFYDSNDVKLYVHLPINPRELYLAKIISSLGMGTVFLMPIFSLFVSAYSQLFNLYVAIPLALLMFVLVLISSTTVSLYLNSMVGKIIVRSPHRKTISTALMFLSTLGALGIILYLNSTNQSRMMTEGLLQDRTLSPYFRGFYDVMTTPFGLASLLNFWLPLVIVLLMIFGISKYVMPNYYREVLYTSSKTKAKARSREKSHSKADASLQSVLTRHHISTLQNATLLIQTYIMPLVLVVMFITPSMNGGLNLGSVLTNDYFGLALLLGIALGSFCSMPTTFLAVGISLEKDNLVFIKTLPLNFRKFLLGKFIILGGLQAIVPALIYFSLGLFLLKLPFVIIFAFILGLLAMIFIQGQLMFARDYKLLDLKWQDITQLFYRGGGQWLVYAYIFGITIIGAILATLTIVLGMMSKQMLFMNIMLSLFLVIMLSVMQVIVYHRFWKKLS